MKKRCIALSACLVVLLCLLLPFFLFLQALDGMTENTVVMTLVSPQGTYTAKVINSDQGAMGGNTLVEVYKGGLFGREKKVDRVYTGPWGEYETMEIYWKNDHCLVINSVEYMVG